MLQTRKILFALGACYAALQTATYLLLHATSKGGPSSSSAFHRHRTLSMNIQQPSQTTSVHPLEGRERRSSFGVGVTVRNSKPMPLLRGAATMTCETPGDMACTDTGMGTGMGMSSDSVRVDKAQRQDKLLEIRKRLRDKGYLQSLPMQSASGSSSSTSQAWSLREKRLHHHHSPSQTMAIIHHQEPSNPSKILPLSRRPSSTSENRTIYFLHIHKAAGTHLCQTARANKLNVSNTNCNVQPDQRCCGGNDTLEAQQAFAQSTSYDLVANERDTYSAMDTSLYRYVVVLRHSQARYRSHWKNMCREHNDTTTTFSAWWTRQPDNWMVRKMCGTRCMGVPKFQLTEELFDYTLERLRLYDDILFTERYNESYQVFANHVGWRVPPPKVRSYDDATFPYAKDTGDAAATMAWDPLMSALDDALYEYALGLYEGEAQPPVLSKMSLQTLRTYLADGPGRMCDTECCHAECSTY